MFRRTKSAETEQEPRRPDRPPGDALYPVFFEKKGSSSTVDWTFCLGPCRGNDEVQLTKTATAERSQLAFRSAVAGAFLTKQPDLLEHPVCVLAAIRQRERDLLRRPAGR